MEPSTVTTDPGTTTPADGTATEAGGAGALVEETLVEEVSIDGMCGVY